MKKPLTYEQVMYLIDMIALGIETWTVKQRKAYDKLCSYLLSK